MCVGELPGCTFCRPSASNAAITSVSGVRSARRVSIAGRGGFLAIVSAFAGPEILYLAAGRQKSRGLPLQAFAQIGLEVVFSWGNLLTKHYKEGNVAAPIYGLTMPCGFGLSPPTGLEGAPISCKHPLRFTPDIRENRRRQRSTDGHPAFTAVFLMAVTVIPFALAIILMAPFVGRRRWWYLARPCSAVR